MIGCSSFLRLTVEAGSWVDGPYNKNVYSPRALFESSRRRTGAAPTLSALAAMAKTADLEGRTGLTHVGLVGAPAGERYCFPGAGQPPDSLVPVRSFQAEEIINNYLVRLLRTPEGSNGETGEPTLSPSLVTAFIGKDGQPYQYGCLAEIANEEGMVFVMFGDTPLPVSFEDKGCRD